MLKLIIESADSLNGRQLQKKSEMWKCTCNVQTVNGFYLTAPVFLTLIDITTAGAFTTHLNRLKSTCKHWKDLFAWLCVDLFGI